MSDLILVTGSTDGLGLAAAQDLISRGHRVLLHARSDERAESAQVAAPGTTGVVVADASDLSQLEDLAAAVAAFVSSTR